jgi:hypothetical protein
MIVKKFGKIMAIIVPIKINGPNFGKFRSTKIELILFFFKMLISFSPSKTFPFNIFSIFCELFSQAISSSSKSFIFIKTLF